MSKPPADSTRPSLLFQIRDESNASAWADFVRIYTPLIHHFCLQQSRDLGDADAADIAQEVMRTVAANIRRFEYDPNRGSFRSWLLTVTRTRLLNFLKRRLRQPETPGDTALHALADERENELGTDWENLYRRRLFEWAAQRVQSEVQASSWQAFWLTAVEGKSGETTARDTGLSIGAVYIARSRITARLRDLVSSVADDPPSLLDLAR